MLAAVAVVEVVHLLVAHRREASRPFAPMASLALLRLARAQVLALVALELPTQRRWRIAVAPCASRRSRWAAQ